MPKWIIAGFAFFLTLTLFAAQAQTADEVISKYVDAMGGKEKLNSINTLHMEGVAVMQNGNELTTTIDRVNGKLSRRESQFGAMGSFTMLITDKGGWVSSPRSSGKFEAIPADKLKNTKAELDCAGSLVDYAAKGYKVEYLGKEQLDGKDCHKIKLTLTSGADITYYIDAQTYYISRESHKGSSFAGGAGGRPGTQDADINTDFSDYQKTDQGYIFPYKVKMGGMGNGMTFEKIEVNKKLDEAKLSKPE
jgi:outer membrane lipoprotein-sorting protein